MITLTATELLSHTFVNNQVIEVTGRANWADTKRAVSDLSNVTLIGADDCIIENYVDLKRTTTAGEWKEVDPQDPTGAALPGSNVWWLSGYNANYFIPDSFDRAAELFPEDEIHLYAWDAMCSKKRYVSAGDILTFTGVPSGDADDTIPNKYGQWSSGSFTGGSGLFIYCEGNPVSGTYYDAMYASKRDFALDFADCSNITVRNITFRRGSALVTFTADTQDAAGFTVSGLTGEDCNGLVSWVGGSTPQDTTTSKFYVEDVLVHDLTARRMLGEVIFNARNWMKNVEVYNIDLRHSGLGRTGTGLGYFGNCAVPDTAGRIVLHDCTAQYHAWGANDNPSDGPIGFYFDSNSYDPTNGSGDGFEHGIHCDTYNLTLSHARRAVNNNSGEPDWRVWNMVLVDVAEVSGIGDAGGGGATTFDVSNISMQRASGDKWWSETSDTFTRLIRAAANVADTATITLRNWAVSEGADTTAHEGIVDLNTATTDQANSVFDVDDSVVLYQTPKSYVNSAGTEFAANPVVTNTDPKFVSSEDLHLAADSTLVNAGVALSYRSEARDSPIREEPDIGAYDRPTGLVRLHD